MKKKGISEIISTIFIMLALITVLTISYMLAQYRITQYKEEASIKRGDEVIKQLYGLLRTRSGFSSSIKVPVELLSGSIYYSAIEYDPEITVSTSQGTFRITSDILRGEVPIIYFVYNNNPIELKLENLLRFTISGSVKFISRETGRTFSLFTYSEGHDHVMGIHLTSYFYYVTETIGTNNFVTIFIGLPTIEDRSVITSPEVSSASGFVQVTITHDVVVFSYEFENPTDVTVTYSANQDTYTESITETFSDVTSLKIRVIYIIINVDMLRG